MAAFVLPFAVLLHQVASDGWLTRFDRSITDAAHDGLAGRDAAVTLFTAITVLGWPPWLALVVAAATAGALVGRRPLRLVSFLVLAPAVGGLLNTAVKELVSRPRPEIEERLVDALGHSFPSGHSMSSVVTYGAVALVVSPVVRPGGRRLLVVGTAVLVGLIGASRVVLGVHYLSDVVAGFLLGAAWLALAARVSGIGVRRPAARPPAARRLAVRRRRARPSPDQPRLLEPPRGRPAPASGLRAGRATGPRPGAGTGARADLDAAGHRRLGSTAGSPAGPAR